MRHTLTPLVVLAVIALSATALAADTGEEALDLRVRLERGNTYQFKTRIEKTTVRWINEAETSETSTLELTQTMQVLSVKDDGTATVKLTYDRVAVTTESENGLFEFDSDNPPEELAFPSSIYAALVGRSFEVVLSPSNEVVKLRGTNALQMAVIGTLSEDGDEEESGGVVSRVVITTQGIDPSSGMDWMRLLHGDGLKEHIAALFSAYPDKPVAVDGTWTHKEKRAGQYATTCDATSKLASRAGGVATIEVEGKIALDADAKGRNFGLGTVTKLEGTEKATLQVDEASGVLVESKVVDQLKGEETMPMMGGGDALPITIDTTTTVKRTKLTQPKDAKAPADGGE